MIFEVEDFLLFESHFGGAGATVGGVLAGENG